ncbi:MAG: hypothetical protein ABJH04_07570 [Cyclobacteriaceae bacterium]
MKLPTSEQLIKEYELFLSSTMRKPGNHLSVLSGLLKKQPIDVEINIKLLVENLYTQKEKEGIDLGRFSKLRNFVNDYGYTIIINTTKPARVGNLDIVDKYLEQHEEMKYACTILNTFIERNEIGPKSVATFLDETQTRSINRGSYARLIERFLIYLRKNNIPKQYKIQSPKAIEKALVQAGRVIKEYELVVGEAEVITDQDFEKMLDSLKDVKEKAILEQVEKGISITDIPNITLNDAPEYPYTLEYIKSYRVTRPKMPLFYNVNRHDIIKLVHKCCALIGKPNTDVNTFRKLREMANKLKEMDSETMVVKTYHSKYKG